MRSADHHHGLDTDRLAPTIDRRRLLTICGVGLGCLATSAMLTPTVRSAMAAVRNRPLALPSSVDVEIFQTAASLENVAVAIYARALDVPGVRQQALLAKFVETTMQQHAEHGAAFNAQVEALGGVRQDAHNPRHAHLVEQLEPAAADIGSFLGAAATLEEAAADSYLANLTLLADATRRTLMASVMGVEVQHLATLRAAGTLFEAALPDLVAIPTDVRRLPATIGNIPVPDPFASPDLASPPSEGAVR